MSTPSSEDPSTETPAEQAIPAGQPQHVENPAVRAAMEAYEKEDTEEVKTQLMHALNSANFLTVVLLDEVRISPIDDQGNAFIEAGSKVKTVTLKDNKGHKILPLFTDWKAINVFMANQKVQFSAWALYSGDAWKTILEKGYAGAIINAGGKALPLLSKQVKFLQDNLMAEVQAALYKDDKPTPEK